VRDRGPCRVDDGRAPDLGGEPAQLVEGLACIHVPHDTGPVLRFLRKPSFGPFPKFFADRGTHLAAMIAYFALVSFVPLTFLALALLGLAHRVNESSYLVTELQRVFPSRSIDDIVATVQSIQRNAATLGIVGGILLIWSSLSLFSALESAFNIVYDRPNRPFVRGKLIAVGFMVTSLVVLFVGLVAGTFGFRLLERYVGGVMASSWVAVPLTIVLSTLTVFLFLVVAYHRLTNVPLTWREVFPGAALGAVALQATFQALPIFLRISKHVVALQALGAGILLLLWLYVMANVIVFGAEVNWWVARKGADDISGLA
jgi:membrane protein